jgi:hypothetical protein
MINAFSSKRVENEIRSWPHRVLQWFRRDPRGERPQIN